MKIFKIIIVTILLLILLFVATLPTVYNKTLIDLLGWPDSPERIEFLYGDFDVEVIKSKHSKYYAYKMNDKNTNNEGKYFVIHYSSSPVDEVRIHFYTYEGTDWIEEVQGK